MQKDKDSLKKPQIRPIIKPFEHDPSVLEKDIIVERLQYKLKDVYREIDLNWGRLRYKNPALPKMMKAVSDICKALDQMMDYQDPPPKQQSNSSGFNFGTTMESIR